MNKLMITTTVKNIILAAKIHDKNCQKFKLQKNKKRANFSKILN